MQNEVASILRECSFTVETPKVVTTVRGEVEVDVFAQDPRHDPQLLYVVECKNWTKRVDKGVVHAFRTVVADFGANWGAIVSSSGFQRGAFAAAEKSNVRLLNWVGFNDLFSERWIERFLAPQLYEAVDPLIEYTEPVNSRIFRKAGRLPEQNQTRFRELREEYAALAFYAGAIGFRPDLAMGVPFDFGMPSQIELIERAAPPIVPADVANAPSLRDYLDRLLAYLQSAVAEFDDVFGERA